MNGSGGCIKIWMYWTSPFQSGENGKFYIMSISLQFVKRDVTTKCKRQTFSIQRNWLQKDKQENPNVDCKLDDI